MEKLRVLRAGAEGIEPPLTVLETAVLPFNYAPIANVLYLNSLPQKNTGAFWFFKPKVPVWVLTYL